MLELPLWAAQQTMLATLGLLYLPEQPTTKTDVLAAIRQMHLLQIDTISVVARSHYLVLWSRLGNYQLEWLDELLAERQLFEYWSHAACFLPIEDYGIYRRQMFVKSRWQNWLANSQATADKLLEQIRANGAVRAADFERPDKQKGQGWWDWKPEKIALEALFYVGDLMIAKRHNFQRYYDLRERVLPEWDDSRLPSSTEAELIFTRKALLALGVAQPNWLANYFYRSKKATLEAIKTLMTQGEMLPLKVEGWNRPAYVHRDNIPLIENALAEKLTASLTTLLSPFDPLISDRERVATMFGFDYNIECYTPATKRRYGYFTLPILHKGALVGRVDAKAHRRTQIFEVISLHLEPQITPSPELARDLVACLQRCAVWHNTPEVVISRTDPPEFADDLHVTLTQI